MAQIETAGMIAHQRSVTAQALLEGRADLRGYPFRYLAIYAYINVIGERALPLLAAIELVEQWGWELITIMECERHAYAFMRRIAYQPAPAPPGP